MRNREEPGEFGSGSTLSKTAIALIALTIFTGASKAEGLPGVFQGSGYGVKTSSDIGPATNEVQRVANVYAGCAGTGGKLRQNEAVGIKLRHGGSFILRIDSVKSTALTKRTASTATAHMTDNIAHLNLFDGLISARSISADARVAADANTIKTDASASSFQNLRIAGKDINSNVAPNTQIPVAGLGTVTVKRIVRHDEAKKGSIKVDMLHIVARQNNNLGLPAGSLINIGHALAGFERTSLTSLVGGGAFLATATSAGPMANQIGKLIALSVPCGGTNGKTVTASLDALSVANLLQINNGETTVFGGMQNGAVVVKTTAAADHVRLLGNLIGAKAIRVVAQDTYRSAKRQSSTAGTEIAGLVVDGASRGTVKTPNERINIKGMGYVVVNETELASPSSNDPTIVRGLHLYVTQQNSYGLPVGAEIIVGQASSVVHPSATAHLATATQ